MTVAMMLPSSMPMVQLVVYAGRRQARPVAIPLAFLAGYAVIWTAFAAGAFLTDTGVHRLVDLWPWLAFHSWLIGAVTFFLFTPPGEDERLIQEAGFALVRKQDVTENNAVVPKRWYDARARRRAELIKIEGEAEFEKTQRFLAVVHTLVSERRLSRFAFLAQK
jgi:hypothetical protein